MKWLVGAIVATREQSEGAARSGLGLEYRGAIGNENA